MDYYWSHRVSPELVALKGPRGKQLWGAGKTRKPAPCAVTGDNIPTGGTAYRPVGNSWNRYVRISVEGIAELEREG